MSPLILNNKLLTFVGTGGVGKTSLSLAFAIQAARQGQKVATITIDPSRRLFSILNPERTTQEQTVLNWPEFKNPMSVYQVDTEKIFQEFIRDHLGESFYSGLKKNKIYQQISKNLRETHNFASLYKMHQIFEKKDYDLIVLDTPPCHQVIDFFDSPERLQKFFSSRDFSQKPSWMNWVQRKGVQAVEGVFSSLVGKEFIEEMESFFSGISQLREKVKLVTESFNGHLRSDDAQIILIFSSAQDKVAEAQFLDQEIREKGYSIAGSVLNRAYSLDLDLSHTPDWDLSTKEGLLAQYFYGQKERSLSLINDLKEKSKLDHHFYALLPEIKMSLENQSDILDFSNKVKEHWTEL